jgi:hypothetical protein
VLAVPVVLALSPLIVAGVFWDRYREGTLRRRLVDVHGAQCRGILVYSNSPNWQEYIEANWLPRLAGRLVLLNWSERSTWDELHPLEAALARKLGDRDFNPAAIILTSESGASVFSRWWRALRTLDVVGILVPAAPSKEIIRFFRPFRDHKHGKHHTLRAAEKRMWKLLDASEASGDA